MTYYKIVGKNEAGLCSYSWKMLPSELVVKYVVGEFVSSVNPLFIFSGSTGMNHVSRFIKPGFVELWSCEVLEPRPHKTAVSCVFITNGPGSDTFQRWFLRKNHIERYWAGSVENSIASPVGTYICDSVKLVERVM